MVYGNNGDLGPLAVKHAELVNKQGGEFAMVQNTMERIAKVPRQKHEIATSKSVSAKLQLVLARITN